MKLETPENENYSAVVIEIKTTNPLLGLDNLVGVPILGFQAVVSKDTPLNTLGIVFPAETQLSEEYTKQNNLYRHSELNKDSAIAGYIEDNRRVRAMQFRGNRSNALFMPLSSLKYLNIDTTKLQVGDIFDSINGHEICKKYVVTRKITTRIEKNKGKVFKRVDEKFLPEHYETDQYWRNRTAIKPLQKVIVTQKLHGTSIRIANTIVKRKLNIAEKALKKLNVKIQETDYDHVYGSRKVIKDSNNPAQNHFYGDDIWTEIGKRYDDSVPQNFIIYGEVIGWTPNGAPIQKNYTYNIPAGTQELYVYRVALVTNQGMLVDLAWEQVKEFCRDHNLHHVPELWSGMHRYFKPDDYIDSVYSNTFKSAIPLAPESPVDEGVCIRVDGLAPYILKLKSPKFLEHETKMLDEEVTDFEEEGKIDV